MLHNLRLVHSVASGYPSKVAQDQEDLAQHGMFGLLRAVEKSDATRGLKFSTYAVWWIRQAITRAIADVGTTIRIPVHLHEKIQKVQTVVRPLLSDNVPTDPDRLCEETGYDRETVEQCLRLARGVVSLDIPLAEDGDGTLGDFIQAPLGSGSYSEEVIDEQQLRDVVRQALGELPERQAHVIAARHGLDRDEPATLAQLADELGLSRERIRQIESQAAERLVEALTRLGSVTHRQHPQQGSFGPP